MLTSGVDCSDRVGGTPYTVSGDEGTGGGATCIS